MSPACKWCDLIVMGGLEQASFANVIFLSIAKAKACWKAILRCCLKNWMQKNKDKWPFDHLLEKMGTFLDKIIHIALGCAMHLHGHQNKVVPLMKPSILVDFNNGIKFRSCTYWSTNDTWSHHFSCRVNNHHIDKKDLVLSGHVEIGS